MIGIALTFTVTAMLAVTPATIARHYDPWQPMQVQDEALVRLHVNTSSDIHIIPAYQGPGDAFTVFHSTGSIIDVPLNTPVTNFNSIASQLLGIGSKRISSRPATIVSIGLHGAGDTSLDDHTFMHTTAATSVFTSAWKVALHNNAAPIGDHNYVTNAASLTFASYPNQHGVVNDQHQMPVSPDWMVDDVRRLIECTLQCQHAQAHPTALTLLVSSSQLTHEWHEVGDVAESRVALQLDDNNVWTTRHGEKSNISLTVQVPTDLAVLVGDKTMQFSELFPTSTVASRTLLAEYYLAQQMMTTLHTSDTVQTRLFGRAPSLLHFDFTSPLLIAQQYGATSKQWFIALQVVDAAIGQLVTSVHQDLTTSPAGLVVNTIFYGALPSSDTFLQRYVDEVRQVLSTMADALDISLLPDLSVTAGHWLGDVCGRLTTLMDAEAFAVLCRLQPHHPHIHVQPIVDCPDPRHPRYPTKPDDDVESIMQQLQTGAVDWYFEFWYHIVQSRLCRFSVFRELVALALPPGAPTPAIYTVPVRNQYIHITLSDSMSMQQRMEFMSAMIEHGMLSRIISVLPEEPTLVPNKIHRRELSKDADTMTVTER